MLVFRKNLYLQSDGIKDKSDVWKELCDTWIVHCDGKTKDELEAEGYVILDEWCEDVPPVHNPWRTFDEEPKDEGNIIVKMGSGMYRAAYYDAEYEDICSSEFCWTKDEAIELELKWKYIEDEEEE